MTTAEFLKGLQDVHGEGVVFFDDGKWIVTTGAIEDERKVAMSAAALAGSAEIAPGVQIIVAMGDDVFDSFEIAADAELSEETREIISEYAGVSVYSDEFDDGEEDDE